MTKYTIPGFDVTEIFPERIVVPGDERFDPEPAGFTSDFDGLVRQLAVDRTFRPEYDADLETFEDYEQAFLIEE